VLVPVDFRYYEVLVSDVAVFEDICKFSFFYSGSVAFYDLALDSMSGPLLPFLSLLGLGGSLSPLSSSFHKFNAEVGD